VAASSLAGHPARRVLAPEGTRRHLWLVRLSSPVAAYYLILGATGALTVLGLVMVLSSSNVDSLVENGNSFSVFAKQAAFAAIAVPLAYVASRVPARTYRRMAWPLLGLAAALLVAVALVGIGGSSTGNQNWLVIGPVTIQPSEAAKLSLIVWTAAVLARKRPLLGSLRHLVIPVVPGAMLVLALVLLGKDLGTAMVMMAILGGLLFVAGAPLRLFLVGGALAAGAVAAIVSASPNKMQRIDVWLGHAQCDRFNECWQSTHGTWALATGGWWGVGLGVGREKWGWLPEAHNDYIFAIIGEELGLAGTLAILVLFALLALGLYRLVVSTDDYFVKVVSGGVLVWIIGQALINVAVVLGVLPVLGVPLPLVSSGGSALITTLVGLGMVIGFARRLPGAAEALAAQPRIVRRSVAILPRRLSRVRAARGSARRIRPARGQGR
jgi:cell division protein FtsW